MLLRPAFGSTDNGASKRYCRVRAGWRRSAIGRGCVKTLQHIHTRSRLQIHRETLLTGLGTDSVLSVGN